VRLSVMRHQPHRRRFAIARFTPGRAPVPSAW